MSHFIDKLKFLSADKEEFSEGHGQTTTENRAWEDAYRKRWQHDKIVRSTHGTNCTGSCSWKIYVKLTYLNAWRVCRAGFRHRHV